MYIDSVSNILKIKFVICNKNKSQKNIMANIINNINKKRLIYLGHLNY
jgi:hypothetical protein